MSDANPEEQLRGRPGPPPLSSSRCEAGARRRMVSVAMRMATRSGDPRVGESRLVLSALPVRDLRAKSVAVGVLLVATFDGEPRGPDAATTATAATAAARAPLSLHDNVAAEKPMQMPNTCMKPRLGT